MNVFYVQALALIRSKIDLAKIEEYSRNTSKENSNRRYHFRNPKYREQHKNRYFNRLKRQVLQNFGIRIANLVKIVKLWLTSLDDSITVSVVAKMGNCIETKIQTELDENQTEDNREDFNIIYVI